MPPSKNSQDPPRRRMERRVLAEWRGIYVPPDLSGYEKKIGSVISRVLKKAGVVDRLSHEQIAADWAETVGEFLAKHSRPVSLQRGVLRIAVLQAAVRYDLERNHKKDILTRLQKSYGKDKLRELRFQSG